MPCVVPDCRNNAAKKSGAPRESISFHRFPENDLLRKAWVDAVGRINWVPTKYSRICSKHFKKECFITVDNRKYLVPNAVPTIFQRPVEEWHLNKQSDGENNKTNVSDNNRQAKAIPIAPLRPKLELVKIEGVSVVSSLRPISPPVVSARTSRMPKPCILRKPTRQPIDKNNKKSLNSTKRLPNAISKPTSRLIKITCGQCLSLKKYYEEVMTKQNEEIGNLSNEVDELRKMLEKTKKDLEKAKTVAKRRQQLIWRLRKRDQRNSLNRSEKFTFISSHNDTLTGPYLEINPTIEL